MKLRFLLPLMVLLSACSMKFGNNELAFFQMQVREGSASIYSTKLYGVNIETPMFVNSAIGSAKFTLGYVAETKSLIPTKVDGELPNVLIDLTQEGGGTMSDTYTTGAVAADIYANDLARVP